MQYFQKFPETAYTTTEVVNGISQTFVRRVPNMTVRFKPTFELGDFQWYVIQDRDRPDTLAAQWYRTTEYTWVVLLSNEMRDLYDWPMSASEFAAYMNKKYESGVGINDGVQQSQSTIYAQYWINSITGQNLMIDETTYNTLPNNEKTQLTVYDYETNINDAKRNIKWLNPSGFATFVNQFETSVSIGV